MARGKTLALILAGGAGGRLETLTQERAKPAMPYAGVYRLIDFPLSNCANSGLADVWIVEQYQPHSLNSHLANGRPWDLDRTYGGLQILPPYQDNASDEEEGGFAEGNADAIYRNRALIRAFAPDTILVLSADHVYTLDYRDVLGRHREAGADVTMVTTTAPEGDDPSRFGVVQVGDDGRVTDFAYKPEQPRGDLVTTEVFVYDARALLDTLDQLAGEAEGGEDGPRLADFGNGLLPRLVAAGRAYEHRLDGYWRDVGTIASYWRSHMELLDPKPRLDLDRADWPIRTRSHHRPPARIAASARIDRSLIAPGCAVRGTVLRSVLAPGVVVAEGATVRDAIVLHDTVIEAGATVDCAVVDERVRVGEGARIGARREAAGAERGGPGATPEIAAVGMRVTVRAGGAVAADAQVAPGETV